MSPKHWLFLILFHVISFDFMLFISRSHWGAIARRVLAATLNCQITILKQHKQGISNQQLLPRCHHSSA